MSEVEREDRLELVKRLQGSAAAAAAAEEVKHLRREYFLQLAAKMYDTGKVDELALQYKRGFFRGAIWALTALPERASLELEKELERELKEGDS